MGKRRLAAALLAVNITDDGFGVADFFFNGFQYFRLKDTAFFIDSQRIVRDEFCLEGDIIFQERADEFVEILTVEILDFGLTTDDKGQRRNEYPAYPQCRVIAVFTGILGIGPAQVDADEPVGPFTGKTGFIQRLVFLVVLNGIEGPFHADVIFGIDEETFNFSVIIVIFQYFIDEQLAFPVRVTGMDDDVGFLEELSQA